MLLDIRMPIMSGLEVMAEVAASPPPYPIVRQLVLPSALNAHRDALAMYPSPLCCDAPCCDVEVMIAAACAAPPQVAMTGHVDIEAREQFR
jgi:CheY-like chemotaxis protein